MKVKTGHIVAFLTFFLMWQGSIAGKVLPVNIYSKLIPLFTWMHIPVTIFLIYFAHKKHNKKRKLVAKNYLKTLIILPIAILITAPLYYYISSIARGFGISYITRWSSEFLSRACILISIYCLFVICGEEIISIASGVSLFLSGFLFIFCVINFGILETIKGVFKANTAVQNMMETNDISFTIGIFILYLLLFDKKVKYRKYKLILGIVFFFMAGKRIAIAGIFLAIIMGLYFRHKNVSKRFLTIFGVVGVSSTMVFLYAIYNSSLMSILNVANINMMGREIVYPYFARRSSFGPQFLGWGQAAVSKMLEEMSFEEVGNMVVLRGLHSDIFRRYLDCGFIGYLFWSSFNLIYLPRQIYIKFGNKAAEIYLMLSGYAFVTYLTDNSESMYTVQVLIFLIPIIYFTQNVIQDKKILERIKRKGALNEDRGNMQNANTSI